MIEAVIKQMAKFNDLALARSYANRCPKIQLIILGDNGQYWVGLPRYTEQLHKAGYQYAE